MSGRIRYTEELKKDAVYQVTDVVSMSHYH